MKYVLRHGREKITLIRLGYLVFTLGNCAIKSYMENDLSPLLQEFLIENFGYV